MVQQQTSSLPVDLCYPTSILLMISFTFASCSGFKQDYQNFHGDNDYIDRLKNLNSDMTHEQYVTQLHKHLVRKPSDLA